MAISSKNQAQCTQSCKITMDKSWNQESAGNDCCLFGRSALLSLFAVGKPAFPFSREVFFLRICIPLLSRKKEGCEEKEKLFLPDFTALDLLWKKQRKRSVNCLTHPPLLWRGRLFHGFSTV